MTDRTCYTELKFSFNLTYLSVHVYIDFDMKSLRKGLDTVESLSAGAARDPNRNIGTVIIIYIFVTFTNLTLY